MPPAPQELRTFFVTSVTASRRRLFQVESNALLFIRILLNNRDKGRLSLNAFVVMPDHIHLLLTPAPEISLEKVMQYLKGGFSFQLKSKMDVWERSFTEHRVKDSADFDRHRRYIECNPVRAGLAIEPTDYPYSSACHQDSMDAVPVHLA